MTMVITIEGNVVMECRGYKTSEEAEKAFTETALQKGALSGDLELHLEEGYYMDCGCGSVCLVHPDIQE